MKAPLNIKAPQDVTIRLLRRNIWFVGEGRCAYCGDEVSQQDFVPKHVVPRVEGGKTNWGNIVVNCPNCWEHVDCVRCGYCCSRGPCGYGKSKPEGGCAYLTPDNLCAIYDQIVADPNSVSSPAFGAGCSSSLFNTVRDAKIRKDRSGA